MIILIASSALPARRLVLAEVLPSALTRSGVTIALGAALTALAAQISFPIPGSPVPVTGQTFAVLLTAAALGPARGLAAQLLYLLLGVVGLPVFAGLVWKLFRARRAWLPTDEFGRIVVEFAVMGSATFTWFDEGHWIIGTAFGVVAAISGTINFRQDSE